MLHDAASKPEIAWCQREKGSKREGEFGGLFLGSCCTLQRPGCLLEGAFGVFKCVKSFKVGAISDIVRKTLHEGTI